MPDDIQRTTPQTCGDKHTPISCNSTLIRRHTTLSLASNRQQS